MTGSICSKTGAKDLSEVSGLMSVHHSAVSAIHDDWRYAYTCRKGADEGHIPGQGSRAAS